MPKRSYPIPKYATGASRKVAIKVSYHWQVPTVQSAIGRQEPADTLNGLQQIFESGSDQAVLQLHYCWALQRIVAERPTVLVVLLSPSIKQRRQLGNVCFLYHVHLNPHSTFVCVSEDGTAMFVMI
jgi:hypothetical protein